MRALSLLAFGLLPACAGPSSVSSGAAAAAPALETIAPRPEDVGSVDGILRAFYEVTNVPPGGPADWARDRTPRGEQSRPLLRRDALVGRERGVAIGGHHASHPAGAASSTDGALTRARAQLMAGRSSARARCVGGTHVFPRGRTLR